MPDSNLLQAILNDPRSSPEEKEQAKRELDAHEVDVDAELPVFSEAAQAMLRRFGKRHLAEITDDEWERYVAEQSITWRDPLTKEVRDWVPGGDEILDLLGISRADWWRATLNRATSDAVRTHAREQLRLLEANDA